MGATSCTNPPTGLLGASQLSPHGTSSSYVLLTSKKRKAGRYHSDPGEDTKGHASTHVGQTDQTLKPRAQQSFGRYSETADLSHTSNLAVRLVVAGQVEEPCVIRLAMATGWKQISFEKQTISKSIAIWGHLAKGQTQSSEPSSTTVCRDN